ncbi:hypothetical protein [Actinophytocola gossypii]|uniref:Uncharacterized protein n=1 Tax=Actinophytocola gossypii TaxID=2812003 RepID=A0ABT2J5M2_9PSEU|nr:hypothetical protein [Actinophytocola gossypii]MCT2583066.1 hypothetical protein [Actinophytocola gossypii]
MLMSEDVRVHYSQIYVTSGHGDVPDLREALGGQRNGLCGAARPGALYLVTGLHTGTVGFAAELHEQAPPVDESWEDVVEVSFRPIAPPALVGWGGEGRWPLDLAATDYRVRYSGTGMDQARAQDTRLQGEPEVDRYLLQFWPAPPAPDEVLRQTSATAAYWHGVARKHPPPPTPEDRALAEDRDRRDRARAAADRRLRREEREWGGRLPGERLRRLRGSALTVARLDRAYVEALAEADPATQRDIARWVTRRAYDEAGLTGVDWIDAALAAMDRGEPLPAPFGGDDQQAWQLLFADERVPSTLVTSPDGRLDNCSQQAMAFPAVFSAREADPLRAAVDAIHNAAVAFGYGRHPVLFAELRRAFPAVAGGAD